MRKTIKISLMSVPGTERSLSNQRTIISEVVKLFFENEGNNHKINEEDRVYPIPRSRWGRIGLIV